MSGEGTPKSQPDKIKHLAPRPQPPQEIPEEELDEEAEAFLAAIIFGPLEPNP